MKIVRIRVNAIFVYLLVLFFYGMLMMSTRMIDEDPEGIYPLRYARHQKDLLSYPEEYFQRIRRADTVCQKTRQVKSHKMESDAGSMICLDKDVSPFDDGCIVYVFGIKPDTKLFEEMIKYGCKVYGFDHALPLSMVPTHLGTNFKFYPYGLIKKEMKDELPNTFQNRENPSDSIILDTFPNIQNKIGHENRKINYMKMDIGRMTWRVLPTLINENHLRNVQQIAISINYMFLMDLQSSKEVLSSLQYIWDVLGALSDSGFSRADYKPDGSSLFVRQINRTIPSSAEVLYIRRDTPPIL